MLPFLVSRLQSLMQTARETYGVDPFIFLGLYLGCTPFWYYSIFRTLRSVAARNPNAILLWTAVFMLATVIPFVYVMAFGRNIPWWVYALIAVLVIQGLYSLVRKLRPAPPST